MEDSNNTEDGAAQSQAQDDDNQVNSNDQQRFSTVKGKALEELLVLLPEANGVDAERRFEIYVNDLHETGNAASAEAALDAALAIEDHNARAEALSELVDEIDYFEISKQQA